jgi:PAS domain S-box-containing protein
MSGPNEADSTVEAPGTGLDTDSYRKLVEETPDITVVVDADGTLRYANSAVKRLLDYDSRDIVGDSGCEYVHPDDRDVLSDALEAFRAYLKETERVEFRCRRADGEWRWFEATMRSRLDDDIDGIIVSGRDITERKERTEELRATKERMELALEGTNLGVWDWDMETHEVDRDELLIEMLGYTESGMGEHIDDWKRLVHPEGRKRHDQALADHVENETPYYECESRLETNSGDWKWVRTMGKVVERDETGTPVRAVGIHQDIDERKRTKLALKSERDLFRGGPAVVFKWEDADGWPVSYVSENVESVFGYTADELQSKGLAFADLVHEDDLDRLEQEVTEYDAERGELFSPDPYRIVTAGGEIRWVMEYTKNLPEDGEHDYLLGYLVDITERKEREQRLEIYQSLFEHTNDSIVRTKVIDGEPIIRDVNAAFEEMFGYDREALIDESLDDYIIPERFEDEAARLNRRLIEEDHVRAEVTRMTADGPREFLLRSAYYEEDAGYIIYTDITEHKEYERELKAREEKYRNLFEDTRDALMLIDRDGYLDCNEQALDLFGVKSVDAFLEYSPWELSPSTQPDGSDSKEAALDRIETAFEEGEAFFEWTHQRLDGTNFPAEVKLSRFEYEGEHIVHALVRDISDRKAQERELRIREEKYRNLFEDTRDALMLLDRDGFFDCNEQSLDLFGVESVEEFVDYSPWNLSPSTQPDGSDSKEAALDRIEEAFEEGEAFFEWTHQRLDGIDFPAEVKLSRFEHQGEPALHALVRDITERKEYERRLEEQRDNLDVLNQVLRHDIRNDIQLITTYAELLERECDDETGHEYIETILENADHAVELTTLAREMADVMLSVERELNQVRLRPVLEGEIEEEQAAHPEATVTAETTIPPVSVQADDMLGSVFRNVLKNAVQHNDKAVPRVAVSTRERDGAVVVRVADNGPGVPDNQKDAIFGKGEKGLDSQGTGIGLYLVKTLVESYGGDIWVEDRTGEEPPSRSDHGADRQATDSQPTDDTSGAVFVVELPKATPE